MKKINDKAPVTCIKSIAISAKKEKVWSILSDINNWRTWQTDISSSKLNGVLITDSTFDWKTGGTKIHSKLHTVKTYEQLGWSGKVFGVLAIHNWNLKEIDGETIVQVEESMEGFIAKLFKKSMSKKLEEGMLNWLELLKKESEK